MRQSFRRLIERVATILPAETEVLWQTGSTPIERLGIKAQPFMPARALAQAAGEADVVIAHAGCGSALMALKAGKYPLLVARDPSHGEVVDGHQAEIAQWLSQRNLALERTPDQLTLADLQAAAGRSVVRLTVPPAFELSGGRQARS